MAVIPCRPPLDSIAGTGFNTVLVPDVSGASYNDAADKLLYEIWQTLLLILTALGGGMVTQVITFTIGDGQAGTPANLATTLQLPAIQGQAIFNRQLLVLRNGIELKWDSAVNTNDIRRFNSGGNGGWTFEAASGLFFATGDVYDVYVIGINNTVQV